MLAKISKGATVFGLLLGLFWQCDAPVESAPESSKTLSDSSSTVSLKSSSSLDSIKDLYGIGIVELSLRPKNYRGDSLLLWDDEGKPHTLALYDRPGWELMMDSLPYTQFIQAFQSSGFAHHYRFIWKVDQKEKGKIAIQSLDSKQHIFWLVYPDRYQTIPWERFWRNRILAFKKGRAGVYQVDSVSGDSLLLRYLPRQETPTDSLSFWQPWLDTEGIPFRILTDIDLETYFLPAH